MAADPRCQPGSLAWQPEPSRHSANFKRTTPLTNVFASLRPRSSIRLVEYILDTEVEGVGAAEGERPCWIEPAVLDGVDGLARDVHTEGTLGRAPARSGQQPANTLLP